MIGSIALLSPLLAPALVLSRAPVLPQDFELEPKALEWSELAASSFDRRWTLPEEADGARDLLAEMRRLSKLRFTIDLGAGPQERCFGDLVAKSHELDATARRAWIDDLERRAPRLMTDWGSGLRELLLDDKLSSDRWEPSKDHPRDGLLIAEDWRLDERAGAPWSGVKVDVRFAQAAALFHADLPTIKDVENDYRRYRDHPGSKYEEINPKRGSHFRGTAPDGTPFASLALKFRCDLPFPYSGYTCNLRILNRVDQDGVARTDIYSTSRDFYYLGGRDVFLPVADSEGRLVAFLLVRHFGFDLRGVPDRSKHRAEALRGSLGNLKRNAERRSRERGGELSTSSEAVADFRVLGRN